MRKVELLAPAGSMEALKAAVQNGCDAVYLGGTMFGARAMATNFDQPELIQAIQYAHGYGVKVYVTMNTLIFEDEIEEAYTYAKFLYANGVDALIIQDIGLFDRLHQQLPDLELHASTQMHIHNKEGIRLLKESGAKRIVLPRETTIEEVKEFAKEGIELEVFVHGALCISYSGQCLMSEMLFQRSGNRGACAQACRMKYRLIKEKDGKEEMIQTDGAYLLSPRDLNTLEHIQELMEAGITSFKIEGRMKRPEYVANVVAAYRQAIDAYQNMGTYQYTKEVDRELRLLFHRQFTAGYLFHEENESFMNPFRPNHMGIPIGKVVRAQKKKITIALQEELHQGDGIRILQTREDRGFLCNKIYKDGLLVKEAKKHDTIELDCDCFIEPQAMVVKTSDVLQLQRLQVLPSRKIPITIQAQFYVGQPMRLQLSDGEHTIVQASEHPIERAKTAFIKRDRIQTQLFKCGDFPVVIQNSTIDMEEDCFLSIKELNQLRRQALTNLMKKRQFSKREVREQPYHKQLLKMNHKGPSTIVIVHTIEQYDACLQEDVSPQYTTSPILAQTYHLPNSKGSVVAQQDDSELVCEMGGVKKKNGYICEPSLYAANSYACAFLQEHGIQTIMLPYEGEWKQKEQLVTTYQKKYPNTLQFGTEIYGYRDMMISKYCPIQMYESHQQQCAYCRQYAYYLKDVKGQNFYLMGDAACHMRILSPQPYQAFSMIEAYQKLGITSFQLRFTKETKEETQHVLQEFKSHFTE